MPEEKVDELILFIKLFCFNVNLFDILKETLYHLHALSVSCDFYSTWKLVPLGQEI